MTTTTLHHELPRDVRRSLTADLIDRAAAAEPPERERLVEEVVVANISVARSLASRYAGRGIGVEDLEQVACIGLIKAARRFDPELGEDFLVYAVPSIRGELRRHFRDLGWTVRPPRRLQELQARVVRLNGEADERHSDEELARELDVDAATIREVRSIRGCFSPASLDAPAGADGSPSVGDLIAGTDTSMDDVETRLNLQQALHRLSERERRLVQLRFVEDLTQAEIGRRLGVTQVQVSRLLSATLAKLRGAFGEDAVAA